MLNKIIENNNFKNFTNVEIKYNELIISANDFKGYDSIKEQVEIAKLIDEEKYKIKCPHRWWGRSSNNLYSS